MENEAFALPTAVRTFGLCFGSQPVKVYTDHSPVTFFDRMANQNQKLEACAPTASFAIGQTS